MTAPTLADTLTCPRCAGQQLTCDGGAYCYKCSLFVATPGRELRPSYRGKETRVGLDAPETASSALPVRSSVSGPARTLRLPYPLSTNNLFATVNGHRTKSAAARAYAKEAAIIALQVFREPLRGRVAVQIAYSPKRGVGMDLDNVCKCALDSMKGIAWLDDRQIWDLLVVRRDAVPGGAFTVRIEEID